MGAAERIADLIEVGIPHASSGKIVVVGMMPASSAQLAAVHRELGRACSGNAVLTQRGAVALARYHSKQRTPRAWGRRS